MELLDVVLPDRLFKGIPPRADGLVDIANMPLSKGAAGRQTVKSVTGIKVWSNQFSQQIHLLLQERNPHKTIHRIQNFQNMRINRMSSSILPYRRWVPVDVSII